MISMFRKVFIFFVSIFFLIYPLPLQAESPSRIVSLKPNITEILFDLGVGNNVVGVTTYCDQPAQAKNLPKVGDYIRPFLEKVISVEPDLIITAKEQSSRKAILEFKRMNLNVLLVSFNSFADIKESINKIAEVVNAKQKATNIVQQMQKDLDRLRKKWKDYPKKKVLIVWGRKPLVVGGQASYFNEFIKLAGAANVVQSKMAYPRWNLEKISLANPEVILDLSMGSEAELNSQQALTYWNSLANVKAIQNKQVYLLNNSIFRPSSNIIDGVKQLAEIIHKK